MQNGIACRQLMTQGTPHEIDQGKRTARLSNLGVKVSHTITGRAYWGAFIL